MFNGCPDGYSCQSRSSGVLQGYCCSAQNVCKGGAEFLIDEKSNMPKICTPGAFISCPNGYRCQRSPGSANGYCCKGDVNAVTEGCPPGEYAYTMKQQIVSCDPFNPQNKPCPDKYSCQYAIAYQRYQCCGKEPIEEEEVISLEHGCPVGQVAFVPESTGSPQVCTSSAPNSCPTGYFCQFSDKNKQFQCCAHKSGCPGDSVAYIDISGSPKECRPNLPNQCPSNYSCQMTTKEKYTCCTSEVEGQTAIPPTTMDTTMSWTTHNPKNRPGNNQKCAVNELWIDNECRPRKIGDACVLEEQCPESSKCISLICSCPRGTEEFNGKCIKSEIESLVTLLPGVLPKNMPCKTDEVEHEGKCYKRSILGSKCEISKQCFNGAECKDYICSCGLNTVGYKGRCVTKICGVNSESEPQTKDSMAVICTKSPCTSPFKCTYSPVVTDYICCKPTTSQSRNTLTFSSRNKPQRPVIGQRRIPSKTGAVKYRGKCPDGSTPLMFPRLNVPVACASGRCPKGYTCTQNMCCRTKLPIGVMHDDVKSVCPEGTFETSYYNRKDGSIMTKCGKFCQRINTIQLIFVIFRRAVINFQLSFDTLLFLKKIELSLLYTV